MMKRQLGLLGWLTMQVFPADGYSTIMWGFCTSPQDIETAYQYGAVKVWHTEEDVNLKLIQATGNQIEAFRAGAV
jgi:hypothetical protein